MLPNELPQDGGMVNIRFTRRKVKTGPATFTGELGSLPGPSFEPGCNGEDDRAV